MNWKTCFSFIWISTDPKTWQDCNTSCYRFVETEQPWHSAWVIKSGRENGRIVAIIACVVLLLAGVAAILTVIAMAVHNADDKAESLNRDVATVIIIAGAVAMVTALYIWHKLAGYASVLDVFARGQEDRVLIPSEKALISNVAFGASNV